MLYRKYGLIDDNPVALWSHGVFQAGPLFIVDMRLREFCLLTR